MELSADENELPSSQQAQQLSHQQQQPLALTLADIVGALARGGPQRQPLQLYADTLGDESSDELSQVRC